MTTYNIAGNEVELNLEDGDCLMGVIVIGLVKRLEGDGEGIVMNASDGLGWITQRGMLDTAQEYVGIADEQD
ncbi:hypothetical protein DFO66_103371 [Brevibacterium sanguinis]|uniref:Uncharacterized protein n=2 Tax=Brevibacterium TaxID=1696 RepID=A0A366IKW4_9MICO|nr:MULTISPECIES: hypothetical protein [Brevibacterium]RBP66421.1 hypothetical protein DFO66_103371 [Brevibacterium sanguinis]RBP73073.1 hypothetical protein DFO65_103371 [Brevibacterium celere]